MMIFRELIVGNNEADRFDVIGSKEIAKKLRKSKNQK